MINRRLARFSLAAGRYTFTLLLLGLLMTVLPGPAFVMIPAGLAVLLDDASG